MSINQVISGRSVHCQLHSYFFLHSSGQICAYLTDKHVLYMCVNETVYY